jgi:hypothetical protein
MESEALMNSILGIWILLGSGAFVTILMIVIVHLIEEYRHDRF